jgi:hypothetical protein
VVSAVVGYCCRVVPAARFRWAVAWLSLWYQLRAMKRCCLAACEPLPAASNRARQARHSFWVFAKGAR